MFLFVYMFRISSFFLCVVGWLVGVVSFGLWVNCLAGPFATSNINGERLCTGTYMQADGTRSWNFDTPAQQIASDANSATLDNNVGPFAGKDLPFSNESACILGAGMMQTMEILFPSFIYTNGNKLKTLV